MDILWQICEDYLYLTKIAFSLEIISFVLMSNHFHLIVRTPQANLDKAMNYFLREFSREIGRITGRINQKFGGPYHWSLMKSYHYVLHAYKYVYRNPVEAGIVCLAQDYKYSTLYGLLGRSQLVIPVVEDQGLFENTVDHLAWLNTNYMRSEDMQVIKAALRRREFKFAVDKDRQKHRFEIELS